MTTCGTGGWGGPVPGDPDNSVVLTATAAFGGIDVNWSFPGLNPHAVSHVILYRGVTSSFAGAVQRAVLGSSHFYDKIDEVSTFYYWLEVVSINGTVGELIGPASATSKLMITSLIEQLTGNIDVRVLAPALKSTLDGISILNDNLAAEIFDRETGQTSFADALADVEAGVADAHTFITSEIASRVSANEAIAEQIDLLAVTLGDDVASVIFTSAAWISIENDVENIGALYTAQVDVNGLIGGFGIYNDGTSVEAGFDVDFFWVGRTVNKVKPFIIDGSEVFIDQAVINKLTFSKLIAADGSFIVEDGKIKGDFIETRGLVVRDMLGNALFGVGTPLDWSNVGGTGKPASGATRNVATGLWVTGRAYLVGDGVVDGGYGWECILAHTSSGGNAPPTYPTSSNTYWILSIVGGADGADGVDGADGADGQGQVLGVAFIRAGTAPSTPAGGSFSSPKPTGSPVWGDGIPADDNTPLWQTTRLFTSNGAAPQQAVWSTPAKVGTPATGMRNVFSVLGTTPSIGATTATWHVTPTTDDIYMGTQSSTDNGVTWGSVVGKVKIKGETGITGTTGATGVRAAISLFDVNAAAGAAGYNSTSTYVYLANAAGLASYSAKAAALIAARAAGSSPTTPIIGDTVTFSNGSSFTYPISYNGTIWVNATAFIDGSLVVTNTITADKINSRGLDIKDASGNVILSAGSGLQSQIQVNTNLVRSNTLWAFSGSAALSSSSTVAEDSTLLVFPASVPTSTANSPTLNLIPGTYTVSFRAYSSVAKSMSVDLYPDSLPQTDFALTVGWGFYESTWTITSGMTAAAASCVLRFFCGNTAGQVEICDVKLEAGNRRSLWSPHRLDQLGTNNRITSSNINVFMDNAAINSAQIGNLQVKSANIEDLTVGTSKIAYNSATTSGGARLYSDVSVASVNGGSAISFTMDTKGAACWFDYNVIMRAGSGAGYTMLMELYIGATLIDSISQAGWSIGDTLVLVGRKYLASTPTGTSTITTNVWSGNPTNDLVKTGSYIFGMASIR